MTDLTFMYLLKQRTSQSDSKPTKTSWNQLKRPQKIAKRPKTTQSFKIREIWNILLIFVFQILDLNAQIWLYWMKTFIITFPIFKQNFACTYSKGTDFKSNISFWKKYVFYSYLNNTNHKIKAQCKHRTSRMKLLHIKRSYYNFLNYFYFLMHHIFLHESKV